MTRFGNPAIIIKHSKRKNVFKSAKLHIAGWSSLVARRAHNPKVVSSNLAPATNKNLMFYIRFFLLGTALPCAQDAVADRNICDSVFLHPRFKEMLKTLYFSLDFAVFVENFTH